MRKGTGGLTRGQYRQVNNLLRRENANLREQLKKLQHDYTSLKTAHNKLLEESKRRAIPSNVITGVVR